MKQILIGSFFILSGFIAVAQVSDARPSRNAPPTKPARAGVETKGDNTNSAAPADVSNDFTVIKSIPATAVKNQAMTGTCWAFSTTSLVESQALKNKLGEFDLSEMFTVRNIYIEKAKNYVMRQGNTRFSEGGLGHDQIRAIDKYGAIPENVYSGLTSDFTSFNHSSMVKDLKAYLDTLLKNRPIKQDWLKGFIAAIDKTMGTPPERFQYNNKSYTPVSFAKEVLKFNASDYVNITSFTHHPMYSSFVLEVPDNFSNGTYYNIPLKEMLDLMKTSVTNGYSIMWDADVSNGGFSQKKGIALNIGGASSITNKLDATGTEQSWSEQERQRLFENLTTEDDHLMHIVGLERSKDGKLFYNVKNSWGSVGPYGGFIKVSEAYMAMNTISLVVPRAALSKTLIEKLKL
jgi:bleomycin hydrolase